MSRDSVWVLHLVSDTLADTTVAYRLPQAHADTTTLQLARLAGQVHRLDECVTLICIMVVMLLMLVILTRH